MAATAQAQTTVLAFDDLTPQQFGSNLVYQGYVFSPRYQFRIVPPGTLPHVSASNFLGITLSDSLGGSPNPLYRGSPGDNGLLHVSRLDNQPFSLDSLTAVGVLWGVSSSNGGGWGSSASGLASFSGPDWTHVSWLLFGAGSGDPRGFDNLSLTAVPEPGAFWLFGIGLAALALRRMAQGRPGH